MDAHTDTIERKLELAIVATMLNELGKAGYRPELVIGGGDTTEVANANEVMREVFNLNQAVVQFTCRYSAPGWVKFVFGNGDAVISDYSANGKGTPWEDTIDRVSAAIPHARVSLAL